MLTRYHRKKSSIRRFGTCPLCTQDTKLVADHCHTTGLTRDPLCRKCNMMLGLAADDPALLRRAAQYLERHAAAHAQYRTRI
jgi:hypothetical protein